MRPGTLINGEVIPHTMFGLGFGEVVIILVVALIFLGPERLPEVAKTLGKTMGELRRTMDELRYEITLDDSRPSNRDRAMASNRLPPSPIPGLTATGLKSESEILKPEVCECGTDHPPPVEPNTLAEPAEVAVLPVAEEKKNGDV